MNKFILYCYRLISLLRFKLTLKESTWKFIIIKPILITPKFISLKNNILIRNNARIEGVIHSKENKIIPNIILHKNVSIEQNIHLTCGDKIEIGENTSISANVTISDIIHSYQNILLPIAKQTLITKPVFIGKNCAIYNNSVILPGTWIGNHCVIGANSVVSGKIPDYSIVVGVPAKIIKQYNKNTQQWEKVK